MILECAACALTSVILIVACALTRPEHGQCPRGWYLSHGVQPSGEYRCERPPIGGDDDVLTGKSTAIEQPGVVFGRVYCTGGRRAIVVNHRVVGCQA